MHNGKSIMGDLTKSQYRPDIDGLRAVAVLSVIIHHLSSSILPGGFIGVDVFFVISGFLITSQVYKEALHRNFSIVQFYKRRINRIIPALFTVIAASLIVGTLILSPVDLIRLAKSSIYALLGLSNIFLWREYGNYFSGNASEAPLLHTWSLGVEEQFYVIWPILILIIIKFNKMYITSILALICIGAIAFSEIATGLVASASYYLLPTRFFELMIGGLLALLITHKRPGSRFYTELCFFSGFALIGGSLFFLSKSSAFPGINALWPCIGAALLILAGNSKSTLSKALDNRPMRFIGLISYSLYLWHWPIIAYVNYMGFTIGFLVGASIFLASILLAWLTWKFVEVPMRRSGSNFKSRQVFLWRFVTPALVLFVIGSATIYTGGFSTRFDPRVTELESALETKPNILRSGCHVPPAMYATPPNEKCRLGAEKTEVDGILIGDSFANHFTGMIDIMAKVKGISVMDYTMDTCLPILGYDTSTAPQHESPGYAERCRKRNVAAYEEITKNHFPLVILAGSWPNKPEAGEQLIASIDIILRASQKLTIILRNEEIQGGSSCPIRKVMYGRIDGCEVPRKGYPKYFDEIAKKYPNVHIVDPNQVICTSEACSPTIGNVLLYRDVGHLNDMGSRLIGNSLVSRGVTLSN
jgi:peptidoglycan/LPS O-acetylase OafA/YrhL